VSGTIVDRFAISYSVTITGVNAPAGAPAVIDGWAAGTVVTISAGAVTLDHLVIRNGKGTIGGGIRSTTTQGLTLSYSTVTANAADGGAGLALSGGTTTVTHSTISDNIGIAAAIRMVAHSRRSGVFRPWLSGTLRLNVWAKSPAISSERNVTTAYWPPSTTLVRRRFLRAVVLDPVLKRLGGCFVRSRRHVVNLGFIHQPTRSIRDSRRHLRLMVGCLSLAATGR
jgi:hypothetical protein